MTVDNQKIDILNRDGVIRALFNIIESASENKAGCSFAIDGTWGVGKTFVIEKLEEKLELQQSETTGDDKYFVFHYNCWKYDYYEEPSIAIVSAFKDKADSVRLKNLEDACKASCKVAKGIITKMAKEFVKNKIGADLVQVYEDIKNEEASQSAQEKKFDTLFAFNETLKAVKKYIREMTEYRTVVIVVDELDRCMPSYAIKTLERLHHIFDGIENVVVIIAVDSEQLEQSVREIYGESVDTERYLKKFISFKYSLGIGETQENVIDRFKEYFQMFTNYDEIDNTIIQFFQLSQLDIRTIEKIMEKCQLVHSLVCNQEVSSSVLLYEIMCVVLAYIGSNSKEGKSISEVYGTDLHWIPEFDLLSSTVTEKNLGRSMADFLVNMVKNAGGSMKYIRMNEEWRGVELFPEGICIGYMDYNLARKKRLRFIEETDEIKYEMDVCKRFNEICGYIR